MGGDTWKAKKVLDRVKMFLPQVGGVWYNKLAIPDADYSMMEARNGNNRG
jgi:hypothetical protein